MAEQQKKIKLELRDSLQFARRPRKSKYAGIFSLMEALEEDQAIIVPIREGMLLEKARSSLNSAIYYRGPKPRKGYRWSIRATSDGDLSIFQVKR